MVQVIMGLKGSGKTKLLIDSINTAVKNETGSTVCIEKGNKLTYDISHAVRLVEAKDYNINSFEVMRGFISGLHAGNYDITHVFIESVTKIVGADAENPQLEEFLDWLNAFGEANGIKFTLTISADAELASEGVKKYF